MNNIHDEEHFKLEDESNLFTFFTLQRKNRTTTMITNTNNQPSSTVLDKLPTEIIELLFSYIPFKESYNMRISNQLLSSIFVNYFRRVLRERLQDYNNHLIDKFQIFEYNDDENDRYEDEISKIQDEFNCKIPFLLKELILITKRLDDTEKIDCSHPGSFYPVHWFNPIKTWKKEGHLVRVGNFFVLISNGKYNNLIISTTQNMRIDLWKCLFGASNSLFNIEGDGFPKYCDISCGREMSRIYNLTSAPLTLCLLTYFTTENISPRLINGLINNISDDLWNDRDFLVKAAKIYYKIGRNISETLLEDRVFCLRLVNSHGKMLKYCPKFWKDIDLIRQAAKNNGFSIKYLDPQLLRSFPDIVELAIHTSPHSLSYVQSSFPSYKSLVLKVLKKIEMIHHLPEFINDELLQDKTIVEEILFKSPTLIRRMPSIWTESRALAKKLLVLDPYTLVYFSPKIQKDPRIHKLIAQTKPSAIVDMFTDPGKQEAILFKAWGLPLPDSFNIDEVMSQLSKMAGGNMEIGRTIVLMSFLDYCAPTTSRNSWYLAFAKECIDHKVDVFESRRVRSKVNLFSNEEKEELIKSYIENYSMPSISDCYDMFTIDLLRKYALDALKKGLECGYPIYAHSLDNADELVECFSRNENCRFMCFDRETYEQRCAEAGD